jgi:hypothetical protein
LLAIVGMDATLLEPVPPSQSYLHQNHIPSIGSGAGANLYQSPYDFPQASSDEGVIAAQVAAAAVAGRPAGQTAISVPYAPPHRELESRAVSREGEGNGPT